MEDLKIRVIEMIIKRCRLKEIDPNTCDCDAPLFLHDDEDYVEGQFELDSVDALELVAGIKEEFGVILKTDEMNVFYSINTLTEYIKTHME